MKSLKNIILPLVIILFTVSCSKDIAEKDYLKVTTNNINASAESLSKTIVVNSNMDWKASVSNNVNNWISIKKQQGSLQIYITKNTGFETRKGTITISAGQEKHTITVKQLGKEASVIISTDNFITKSDGEDISFEIISNITYSITVADNIDWITKKSETVDSNDKNKKSFIYTIAWNSGQERKCNISIQQIDGSFSKSISVTQQKQGGYSGNSSGNIPDDIKVPVNSGKASSYQNGEGIEKSFDGNINTIYHSNWNNSSKNYFPITLDYFFKNQNQIDYLIYHPRSSHKNGLFKDVEIWATTESNPTLTKLKDYDFKGSSSTTKVLFDTPLIKPTSIRFIIKSGAGDRQGFASCAEMEFYKKNPNSFDITSIFTDATCSELKSGITEAKIKTISNPLYKNIAFYMFQQAYPREFRIQEYKAWPHPDQWAAKNKTSPYSLLDNPTGIYVNQNEELIIFVDDTQGYTISIKIQNLDKAGGDGYYNASYYTLSKGVNKIKTTNKGLIYVLYHTPNYESAPKVKIHFATGKVNGYFDRQKHTSSEWQQRLAEAKFKYFDVLGNYAHLTFPTRAFRTHAANNGYDLIAQYDNLVKSEQEFMGLMKYNRPPVNRAYFHVMYHAYMYSTSYRTAYNESTLNNILNFNTLKRSPWGPAHELGHTHQTRPGFKWHGMTEVTTNVHSLYIQTLWGNNSRIEKENLGEFTNRYEKSYYHYFVNHLQHNASDDVFCKLVPFWQLQLYFANVKNYKEYYKDFYEEMRLRPNPKTAGKCQLSFVKLVCELTQTNLIDYFTHWGMLSPIDIEIDDYGKRQFTVSQEDINQTIKDIKHHNYPPPPAAIHYICDSNWHIFKNQLAIERGDNAYISGKKISISGWKNVVAYEVWQNEELIYASNKSSFTIKSNSINNIKVYAIGYDGTKEIINF